MNRVAIVDLDSVSYAIFNPNKVLGDDGQPLRVDNKFVYEEKTADQVVDSCEFIMNKILTNCGCDSYIAYIKGKNTTKAKQLIDPNYKADRNKESPKWWDFTKNYLIENWGAIEANDLEVDDYCAITRAHIKDSFLVCIDSDLIGLEGTSFNWKKNNMVGEWITTTAEQAEYKFWSDMITGSHNNTKGIPGKGEKYTFVLFEDVVKRDFSNVQEVILRSYINHFGEELGIEQFYKNYKMLKIPTKLEGFVIPEPIEYKKKVEISEEKGIFD